MTNTTAITAIGTQSADMVMSCGPSVHPQIAAFSLPATAGHSFTFS